MQLLLVRHAIAEDRVEFAKTHTDDDQRPLTGKGEKRMREEVLGLRRVVPEIDILASSPLRRARQTADILRQAYAGHAPLELSELAPGAEPEALVAWLGFLSRDATVALVGHEPDLSALIAWFTTGQSYGFTEFKKGAACLLDCRGAPGVGRARLLWLLPPRHLRLLGGK